MSSQRLGKFALSVVCLVTCRGIRAAEGRIPIAQPTSLDATSGATITGKYVVTQDLVASTGVSGRVIDVVGTGVEDVDIDLNGFTLVGNTSGSGADTVRATNVRSITVRNGVIRPSAPANGIFTDSCRNVVVEGVKFGGTTFAIRVQSLGTYTLRKNIVSGGSGGVWVDGSSSAVSVRGVIEENVIENVSTRAIYVFANGSPVTIRGNQIEHPGFRGIEVVQGSGFLVAENTVRGSGNEGIYLDTPNGCKVSGNVVASTVASSGIDFAGGGGCLVLQNVSNYNAGSGIDVGATQNFIEDNLMIGNNGAGLIFNGSTSNVFGRNTARGNHGTGIGACASGSGGLTAPNYCNAGTGNDSEGGNMMPGPPAS